MAYVAYDNLKRKQIGQRARQLVSLRNALQPCQNEFVQVTTVGKALRTQLQGLQQNPETLSSLINELQSFKGFISTVLGKIGEIDTQWEQYRNSFSPELSHIISSDNQDAETIQKEEFNFNLQFSRIHDALEMLTSIQSRLNVLDVFASHTKDEEKITKLHELQKEFFFNRIHALLNTFIINASSEATSDSRKRNHTDVSPDPTSFESISADDDGNSKKVPRLTPSMDISLDQQARLYEETVVSKKIDEASLCVDTLTQSAERLLLLAESCHEQAQHALTTIRNPELDQDSSELLAITVLVNLQSFLADFEEVKGKWFSTRHLAVVDITSFPVAFYRTVIELQQRTTRALGNLTRIHEDIVPGVKKAIQLLQQYSPEDVFENPYSKLFMTTAHDDDCSGVDSDEYSEFVPESPFVVSTRPTTTITPTFTSPRAPQDSTKKNRPSSIPVNDENNLVNPVRTPSTRISLRSPVPAKRKLLLSQGTSASPSPYKSSTSPGARSSIFSPLVASSHSSVRRQLLAVGLTTGSSSTSQQQDATTPLNDRHEGQQSPATTYAVAMASSPLVSSASSSASHAWSQSMIPTLDVNESAQSPDAPCTPTQRTDSTQLSR